MDQKEFYEKEIIPALIEVLKKLFEKHPEIRKMYEDELRWRQDIEHK